MNWRGIGARGVKEKVLLNKTKFVMRCFYYNSIRAASGEKKDTTMYKIQQPC